jgi:hypothetical protein
MEELVKNPGEVIGRPTEIIKKRVSIGSVKNETFGDFFGQEAKAVSLKYSDKKILYSKNK